MNLLHHNDVVKKCSDIGSAYATLVLTEAMHSKMLWILFGYFKTNKGWAHNLEQCYMDEHNVGYFARNAM